MLFQKYSILDVLPAQKQKLKEKIQSFKADYLLNASEQIEALPLEEHLPAYPSRSRTAPMPPLRSKGQPLKVSAELAARVQQALRLETKKEAEITVGAVIAALEETLLNNLGTEGFSLKVGGFGKFKVRHLKPVEKRVGFSGEIVMTKGRRKVKFVPLGKLRANETFG
jgi:nucleoid DNA-binding protein